MTSFDSAGVWYHITISGSSRSPSTQLKMTIIPAVIHGSRKRAFSSGRLISISQHLGTKTLVKLLSREWKLCGALLDCSQQPYESFRLLAASSQNLGGDLFASFLAKIRANRRVQGNNSIFHI